MQKPVLEHRSETWKQVEESDGRYEVSDLGRVRYYTTSSHKRLAATPQGFLKPAVCSGNNFYPTVCIIIAGKPKTRRVHHLVLEAFVGPRPEHHEALHLNGNQEDNRLCNLKWGTHSENQGPHAHRNGELGRAKLTDEEVLQVRKLHAAGITNIEITRRLNKVSARQIGNILRGKCWAFL